MGVCVWGGGAEQRRQLMRDLGLSVSDEDLRLPQARAPGWKRGRGVVCLCARVCVRACLNGRETVCVCACVRVVCGVCVCVLSTSPRISPSLARTRAHPSSTADNWLVAIIK